MRSSAAKRDVIRCGQALLPNLGPLVKACHVDSHALEDGLGPRCSGGPVEEAHGLSHLTRRSPPLLSFSRSVGMFFSSSRRKC
ncbi:hypothetical protein CDL15_Pgr011200 [Punica granatum]|uniref:Uncharacterized protein n=1 Tax=Punica granatum TaxID=22663 RepID=A0A218WEU9_PUNGR|nr:hypothetical protein CDL15_Pgr011200 [Punica granatum]